MMNQMLQQFQKMGLASVMVENADMAEYTSFKAGGRADLLVVPNSVEELSQLLAQIDKENAAFTIMGKGSNLLVRDGGYRGVIILLGEHFGRITLHEDTITAGAGAPLVAVSRAAAGAGLTGLEFAAGIPGSLGGGVFMNAGAYGGEMKDVVAQVSLLSRDGLTLRTVSAEQMDFGYRHSRLVDSGEIVVEATLQLKKGHRDEITLKMKEYNDRRNQKQPMDLPSAGSFFKRPSGYFAGKLIEDAGLKGGSVGGAQVSALHSGFIVNTGGATATDIITLMHVVQATVLDQFGVLLEPEIRIIGEDL